MAGSDTLKAGIPVSLSGQFQVQGRQALAGLQAWAEDANRAGGVKVGHSDAGRLISIVYYDDASKTAQARQATERLITSDRVDLLFGPYSGVLALASAQVAEGHGRLLWNQGGASDTIYQRGLKWVVGVLTPASRYLAEWLALIRGADPNADSLAIVRASTGAFPKAVTSTVESQAARLGFKISLLREFEPSINDFSAVLDEVERVRPDLLLGVGRIQNDLLLAGQLARRELGLKGVAVVAAPIQQFRDHLGEAADGFVGPSQWEASGNYPRDYGPTSAEVMASLQDKGYRTVDYPMAQAYAAGLVAQRCVDEAGTLEDSALRETAGRLDFSTFYGRFKIDPVTGCQFGRSTVLVQWQQGRKVIVGPPDQRQAPIVYPWRNQT
ncbi:MAG: amino acid ABC transporter substrate-binding protein [Dehalococcoidia bacterium]|nr:amino acid ABC transporter substrate-binding protein [Dehalococcoidia bacterium]